MMMDALSRIRWLLFPILIFLSAFVATSLLNRPASDDFEFMSKLRDLGFNGSIHYFYNHWNTRWIAIGFMNLIWYSYYFTGTLFFYHILSFLLLCVSFYRIYQQIISFEVSFFIQLITSIMSAVAFFYATFSIPDVFFWVNTSSMYLMGCIAFLFALGEIMNPNKKWTSFAIIIVSGIYVGGAYEPLVFTMMISIMISLFLMFRKYGQRAVAEPVALKCIFLLSILMITFTISFAGEGHTIRAAFLPQTAIGFKLVAMVKAIAKMLVLYLPVKLLVALLFSLPWLIIGSTSKQISISNKQMLIAIGGFIFLTILSLFPLVLVMSEMGPERAWTQISLYITLFAAVVAVWFGGKLRRRIVHKNVSMIWVAFVTVFLIYSGITAISSALNYSKRYDERMTLLNNLQAQGQGETVTLVSLPKAGWLHSAEISENTDHFTNRHLKNFLQLDFDVKSEAKKSEFSSD